MEDNYTFLAISPHGNIQHRIEEEQRKFSSEYHITPFYPLICPIKKLENSTNFKNYRLILSEYQQLFQCSKAVFTAESPRLYKNGLYRRLQWNSENKIPHSDLDFKGLKLKEYAFFYGNCKTSTATQPAEFSLQPLTFKVFRLCIITFTLKGNNFSYYTWKEMCSVWIANNYR